MSQEVSSIVTRYLLDTQPGLYKVLAATASTDTTRFVHGPTGIHAQENPDGEWLWMVQDGLGSVTGVVDEDLTLLENRQYAPYGEVWEQTGAEQTPYQFTGEWVDQNELLYLRARYLNTTMGVFVSLDPLETANRYGYVNANPANRVDPSGLIGTCSPAHSLPSLNLPNASRNNQQTQDCTPQNYSDLMNVEREYFRDGHGTVWHDLTDLTGHPSAGSVNCEEQKRLDNCLRGRINQEIGCLMSYQPSNDFSGPIWQRTGSESIKDLWEMHRIALERYGAVAQGACNPVRSGYSCADAVYTPGSPSGPNSSCLFNTPFQEKIHGSMVDFSVVVGGGGSGSVFILSDGHETAVYISGGISGGAGLDAPVEILLFFEALLGGTGYNVSSEASLDDFAGATFGIQVSLIGQVGVFSDPHCRRTKITGIDAAIGASISATVAVELFRVPYKF